MQTLATIIAFACLFWSVMHFGNGVYFVKSDRNQSNANMGISIGWLVAAGVFFLVAK